MHGTFLMMPFDLEDFWSGSGSKGDDDDGDDPDPVDIFLLVVNVQLWIQIEFFLPLIHILYWQEDTHGIVNKRSRFEDEQQSQSICLAVTLTTVFQECVHIVRRVLVTLKESMIIMSAVDVCCLWVPFTLPSASFSMAGQ